MPDEEARQFARAFRRFLEWVHEDRADAVHPVAALLREHVGTDPTELPVVAAPLPTFEHPNVQVAVDAWSAQRSVRVQGLAVHPHMGPPDLHALLHGGGPPVRLAAPAYTDVAVGPGRTLPCLRVALLLVEDERGRYVVLVRGPSEHEGGLLLQVAGLTTAAAQEVLAELAALRDRLDVYRGQVLELRDGGTIGFPDLARTERDDVVLPEAVLRRVERHTLDVAARRDALRAAGQHLKRGLLLYGPPGTGKTHTTRYVVQHLPGTTVLLLSGNALHLIGGVTDLARRLQPSAVVLEDVDLVAEDRGFGPGSSPVLFELLDAMDGAAADADLVFLLTTNRADLLEPALAARPGRVDVAVEIGLPDADARRRLLDVHTRGLATRLSPAAVAAYVERSEGVTASFVKELVRRAVLEALDRRPDAPVVVGDEELAAALEDLLDGTQRVTRALLGVPADQSDVPLSPPVRHARGFTSSEPMPAVYWEPH